MNKEMIKRLGVPIVVFLLLIIVFFSDVVFFNKSLTTSSFTKSVTPSGTYNYPRNFRISRSPVIDGASSAWHYQPAVSANNKAFLSGKPPLWNPYTAAGQPLAADMQSSSFYPFQMPLNISQSPILWDIFLLLRIFLAALFSFLFFKEIGLDDTSSYIGAIIYAFSGYMVRYINIAHLNVDIILPLSAYAFLKVYKNPKKYWPLPSIAIFLAITGGMPESAFIVIGFGVLMFLYLIIREFKKEEVIEKISYLSVSIITGILSSAFILMPFLEFLKLAFTKHSVSNEKVLPIKHIFSLLSPYFMGYLQTWSGSSVLLEVPYISIIAILIVLLVKKKSKFTYFFSFIAIFYIFKAFGLWPSNLTSYIPIFNRIYFFKYGFNLFVFSIACLSAIAIGNLKDIKLPRVIFVLGAWTALIALGVFVFRAKITPSAASYLKFNIGKTLLFLSVATIALVANVKNKNRYSSYALFLLSTVFIFRAALSLGNKADNFSNFFSIAVSALIILIIALLAFKDRTKTASIIGVLIIVELITYIPYYRPVRLNPYRKTPFTSYLKQNSKYERFISLNSYLRPNVSSAYGLYDARSLNALQVKDYFDFWRHISVVKSGHIVALKSNTVIDHPFLNLLGVRYVVADSLNGNTLPIEKKKAILQSKSNEPVYTINEGKGERFRIDIPNGARYLKINLGGNGVLLISEGKNSDAISTYEEKQFFLPVSGGRKKYVLKSLKGRILVKSLDLTFKPKTSDYKLVYRSEPNIYKNKSSLPRVFLVNKVIKENNNWQKQLEELDLNKVAIAKDFNKQFKDGKKIAKIVKYDIDGVKISVYSENDSFLLLTDTFYPGWHCTVDKKPVKIYKSDFLFRGVLIPKGKHTVVFSYKPPSFYNGLYLSISTILLSIFMWLILNYKDKIPLNSR